MGSVYVWVHKLSWRLRTFALIVSAHLYCAREFARDVMHWARALSTQMNSDKADGYWYSFAVGFNDLGRSMTPTYLFRNTFYLQLSPHCPKMNKKSMREVKKISRVLSTRRGMQPSCGCKASETMVAKCELVLWGTSPVDHIWQRTFPFKALIPIFWDLQPLCTPSLTKPDFLRFRCSSRHVLS